MLTKISSARHNYPQSPAKLISCFSRCLIMADICDSWNLRLATSLACCFALCFNSRCILNVLLSTWRSSSNFDSRLFSHSCFDDSSMVASESTIALLGRSKVLSYRLIVSLSSSNFCCKSLRLFNSARAFFLISISGKLFFFSRCKLSKSSSLVATSISWSRALALLPP